MPARRLVVSLGPAIAAITIAAITAGCSGGSRVAAAAPAAPFVVLGTRPADGETIRLNDPLRIVCQGAVDVDSASLATVRFEAFAADGSATGEPVTGTFRVRDDERELWFEPELPRDAAYTTGGLRPAREYRVHLPTESQGPALRDRAGRGLAAAHSFSFRTVSGTTPAELFRDPLPGGPRRTGLEVNTATGLDDVPLHAYGALPTEVRLHFDQALDPAAGNVPVGLDTDPRTRDESARGNVFLEYVDSGGTGAPTWLPAAVELERNDSSGAVIVLRPLGVLPNHATVRVVVEAALADIAGESNVGAPGFDRVFGTFRTAAAWDQQWSAVVERFDAATQVDPSAAFAAAPAEVGPGYVRAVTVLDGDPAAPDWPDWVASSTETVLNTDLATFVPTNGPARTVEGGVFRLRNLTIPAGAVVRGQGTNPLVFVCSGTVTIAGTLTVRGGDGAMAGFHGQFQPGLLSVKGGGTGSCGGGSGGNASPSPTLRDARGGNGAGAHQEPGRGGRGGYLACSAGCYTGSGYNGSGGGSGGGGGALATQGDPHFRGVAPATILPNQQPLGTTSFQQKLGFGGVGCSGGSGGPPTGRTAFLLGGEPADRPFVDARGDNDFWGTGVDLHRNLRITGELAVPLGGSGGGGGGDTSRTTDCSPSGSNPQFDEQGGGGGAGGGVVVIRALGEIWLPSSGRVVADGGHGGGGAMVGSCGEAGGGGGGAGGMVVLMSARAIRIEAHGNPTTNRFVYGSGSGTPFLGNDYAFAISADGGICRTGGFGAVNLTSKYPGAGQAPLAGTTYDQDPLGGLGGMGIVQLMAPAGDNADGTNTVLDDHVHWYRPGELALPTLPAPLGAAEKRALLAWRGFPDANGVPVDDFGQPTAIGSDEGDIRPAPILLPVPYGAKSRARSRWLDTGASQRRPLAAPDEHPRGIVIANGAEPGPHYEFAGLRSDGWAAWTSLGTAGVRLVAPALPLVALASSDPSTTWRGRPAYRLELASGALGSEPNRYTGHEAELTTAAGGRVAGFPIVAHDADTLFVEPAGGALPSDATHVRVVARLFGVDTGGAATLPAWVPPGTFASVPAANVRIGFAFHTQPNAAQPLTGRFPSDSEQSFVHDLQAPDVQAWLAQHRPRYVQWDVTFDLTHDAGAGVLPPLRIDAVRPSLTFLHLPLRW